MPQKKLSEAKEGSECCILKIGRYNNIIQWREDMQNTGFGLYGMTAVFFTTNERYFQPYPTMSDYHPTEGVPPVEAGDEEDELADGIEGPPAPLVPEVTDAHLQKLRESAFEGRRRDMVQQKKDEQKLWALMWSRMSSASQSKV